MSRVSRILIIFMVAALSVLIFLRAVFVLSERYFLTELAKENSATLQLIASGLRGSLSQYKPLPGLLADKHDIEALLVNNPTPKLITSVNQQLAAIASETGASDIYIINAEGLTIAASNYREERSFLGKNFSYRPYFTKAIEGENAVYFALGTTSLKRGFYYSAPILINDAIKGVVTTKVTIDAIEESWIGTTNPIIATDTHGIVFMSNRPGWLFQSISPLSDEALDEIKQSRQYPLAELGELNANIVKGETPETEIIRIGSDNQVTYLSNSADLPEIGWTLRVFAPKAEATRNSYLIVALSMIGLAFFGLILGLVTYRRAKLLENIRQQKLAQEELEHRVKERTIELQKANENLTQEVAERTQTEERLKQTQHELIQAGKLAALGQMSAALSHELNQPLTAIRAYADNAKTFIARNNLDQANENISHISSMANRMADLGNHLRNFARKPKKVIDVVEVSSILSAVETIMIARLRSMNATLKLAPLEETIFVRGGSVRLQQVLVNLVSNALDAMDGKDSPVVEIDVALKGKTKVLITVRDFGNGIDSVTINEIFDPFFTTKGVNEGLGLGLSISYNVIQDFGGNLAADNHPDGGAVFTITLTRAKQELAAAE